MKTIRPVVYLSLVFVSTILASGCTTSKQGDDIGSTTTGVITDTTSNLGSDTTQVFVFDESSYDFGVIKQSGGKVHHDFSFTYQGSQPLEVTGVPTSCACTSATIEPTHLQAGDSGVLTITFNPNLHAEPEGRFFKTASMITEPALDDIPDLKIWVEIDLDLGPEAFELQSDHDDEEEEHAEGNYVSITPAEFARMQEMDDFFLVDTHIPEQSHISGTDAFIPFNEIDHSLDQLPLDKNAKIVLYCRSGSMSRAAAYTLVEHGYTNVYDLVGGKNAYDAYQTHQE